MYAVLQLLLAILAIIGALNFPGAWRLYGPLACLVLMFIVGRLDKERYEKKLARKDFVKAQLEKLHERDPEVIKERESFIANSLLNPKGELILAEAVHSIFKDFGFTVAPPGKYQTVDRMVRIPETQMTFGVEIVMSEKDVEKNHPKINRALDFEREKRQGEKTLIVASTNVRTPVFERASAGEISKELDEFLKACRISFITASTLHRLWRGSKAKEVDIVEVFKKIYSHEGGVFSVI
jgi:urease beta subunit